MRFSRLAWLVFLLAPIFAHAQPTYELTCPAGSNPLYPVGVTFNLATGFYRQWLCVDTSGNVTGTLTAVGGGTVTHTGALLLNLPVVGNGGADIKSGTRTGNTTQFASWTGATTASRCVNTDASGNLQVTAADCFSGPPSFQMRSQGVAQSIGNDGVAFIDFNNVNGNITFFDQGAGVVSAVASGLTVLEGGTGQSAFNAHETLIGQGGISPLISVAPGTAGGVYTSNGPAADPSFNLVGVIPNAQTGATYTVLSTDRAKYVSFSNAGAIAVTLPQAGSAGFTSNFVFVTCDIGAGTATITPTISTISYTNGSTYTSAAATLPLTTGQCAWVYSDNTNYFAIVRIGSTGTTINPTNNVIPRRSNATTFVDSAITDNGTTLTSTERIIHPNGSAAAPAVAGITDNNTGIYWGGNVDLLASIGGTAVLQLIGAQIRLDSGEILGISSGGVGAGNDIAISRSAANVLAVGTGAAGNSAGTLKFKAQRSDTNCQSSGGTCGSAMAGMVSIAAGATTVTVSTTSVTANSEIFIQEDSTLGTALSVTCNTAVARSYQVTTRTAATSFIITASAAPVTNPACLSYYIIN